MTISKYINKTNKYRIKNERQNERRLRHRRRLRRNQY